MGVHWTECWIVLFYACAVLNACSVLKYRANPAFSLESHVLYPVSALGWFCVATSSLFRLYHIAVCSKWRFWRQALFSSSGATIFYFRAVALLVRYGDSLAKPVWPIAKREGLTVRSRLVPGVTSGLVAGGVVALLVAIAGRDSTWFEYRIKSHSAAYQKWLESEKPFLASAIKFRRRDS